jgi:DNA replication protein DnaC
VTTTLAPELTEILARLPKRAPEDVRELELRERREAIASATRDVRARLPAIAKIDDPRWRELVRDARLRALAERYEPARGSLLILGPTGIGKSLTLQALARRMIRTAYDAGNETAPAVRTVWTTGPDLARAIRETRHGSTCALLADARRAPLLVLDEVGQETADPRWLLELVDARYTPRPLPTLSASGLTRAELEARYGSGAVRRLVEPVGAVVDVHRGGGGGAI